MNLLESFIPKKADNNAKLVDFGNDPISCREQAKRQLIDFLEVSSNGLFCTVGLWGGVSKPRSIAFSVCIDGDLVNVSTNIAKIAGLRVDARVDALRLPAHPDLLVQISSILDTVTEYLYGVVTPLKVRMWPEYKEKFFTL